MASMEQKAGHEAGDMAKLGQDFLRQLDMASEERKRFHAVSDCRAIR